MKIDTPLQVLNRMEQQKAWDDNPLAPRSAIVRLPNKANNANTLTKSVIKFLTLSGHQAERISVEGRVIAGQQTYTDVLGHRKTIGTFKRIPSSARKGSADISAIIRGRSVKLEIKYGKDRQSDVQKAYQAEVERAGGVYIIVRTFDQFYEWYNQFISTL